MDGSLMLSVGGTPLTEFRSTRDGEVLLGKTQKGSLRVALQIRTAKTHANHREEVPLALGVSATPS